MKKIDLTKGKVIKVLSLLAFPIMLTSLLQFTYNIVDMFWVGGIGSDAVASIGSASFFISLGYAINALVVNGSGIKISHEIGKKENKSVREYINASIFINLIIFLIYGIILIIFGKFFIGFLGIKEGNVYREAYKYLLINVPILGFSFFNYLFARIVASFGNTKISLIINSLGILINLILDPIMIYVFKYGVLGAGIATLIANIIMFVVYLVCSNKLFLYDFKLKLDIKKIISIIKLGTPIACQRILFTFINIILAKIIARFGTDAIAAQKIGVQVESITYMVIGGFNGAIASFIGQNYGAGNGKRIKEGYKKSIIIGIIYSLFTGFIFIFFDKEIMKIFIKYSNTILIGSLYLRVIGFSQVFGAMESICNGVFQGLGLPKIPAIISIIFTALRIPMAILFSNIIGVVGVFFSITVSSVLKGAISFIICVNKVRKEYNYVSKSKGIV